MSERRWQTSKQNNQESKKEQKNEIIKRKWKRNKLGNEKENRNIEHTGN